MDPTTQMALLVASAPSTASTVELQVACNVLSRVSDPECDDAFVRCFAELGRRLAREERRP